MARTITLSAVIAWTLGPLLVLFGVLHIAAGNTAAGILTLIAGLTGTPTTRRRVEERLDVDVSSYLVGVIVCSLFVGALVFLVT